MPIQFECPQCGVTLQTPAGTAGQQAQCPQCGQLATIPGDVAEPTEAAPGSAAAPPDTDVNPFASPSLTEDQTSGPRAAWTGRPSDSGRDGPPWEREGKNGGTFWRTTQQVLRSPTECFARIRLRDGYAPPVLFLLAGGLAGAALGGMWGALLQTGISVLRNGGQGLPLSLLLVLGFLQAIFVGTVVNLVMSFVNAGITHVMLIMLQAARRDFEATYRVFAYASGSLWLFQALPFLGAIVAMLYSFVIYILGLSRVHDIPVGTAAAAVLIPLLVCCGVCGSFFLMAAVFAGMATNG